MKTKNRRLSIIIERWRLIEHKIDKSFSDTSDILNLKYRYKAMTDLLSLKELLFIIRWNVKFNIINENNGFYDQIAYNDTFIESCKESLFEKKVNKQIEEILLAKS